MSKKPLSTDEWVRRLNEMAQKMAVWERALHPSGWLEQMADMHMAYRDLASQETYDPPIQPGLGIFEDSHE